MSTEQAGATGTETVDAALQGVKDTLQADGYILEWSMEEQNQIGIRVLAGADACEDCLVPPALMRNILNDALGDTPYSVGSVSLPAKS